MRFVTNMKREGCLHKTIWHLTKNYILYT
ncbi:unnamed protein product, partial [Rotaria magnacalcarata]